MFSGLLFYGCKDDPNPQEERLKELTATWETTRVTNDAVDVTAQFSDFELTLSSERTFSTVNGGNPWPASGTFSFIDETNLDVIRRSDGVEVRIVEISATTLSLSFSINSVRSGIDGITGNFTFSLSKQ
ncbi:hypothetical protein BFP97_06970 [Roseivirga sp. 4D4]|nr:hypothetical protein BFP97_06970 [Roseivirga sp. 4D4]